MPASSMCYDVGDSCDACCSSDNWGEPPGRSDRQPYVPVMENLPSVLTAYLRGVRGRANRLNLFTLQIPDGPPLSRFPILFLVNRRAALKTLAAGMGAVLVEGCMRRVSPVVSAHAPEI